MAKFANVLSPARASLISTGTSASAAWVGVEQQTAATSSISVRSDSWPTALITGSRSSATVRHSASSQNAHRSVRLPPPRHTTATSTSGTRGKVAQRRGDGRRRPPVLDRRVGPHDRPAPSPALESGEQVGARGTVARGHDADRLRHGGARQRLLRRKEAVCFQLAAQGSEPREQVPLPGQAQIADAEAEGRRSSGGAGIEIRPAGHDHLGAVPESALRQPEFLQVRRPDGAGHGAVAVAQLEVGVRARLPEVADLPDQQDPRALAQEVAKAGRPAADGKRAGQARVSREQPVGGE